MYGPPWYTPGGVAFVREEEDLCDVGAADTDCPDPDQDLPECPASHYYSWHRAELCMT